MAKNSETEKQASEKDPLILTISELLLLPEKERNKFRHKGGTVTEDPQ
jgi:hypothetical protein